jgi:hypothetical protein
MTVGSEEKDVLDAGANPAISTNRLIDEPRNLFFTEREWSRAVGWGLPPIENTTGMNSFDRTSSTQTDSPKGD